MTPAATERDLEMLAWLAERDLEAVAHAHRQFLAATEPEAVASLGRTYQKVSRCLRSTLALKMKAAEKTANDAARAAVLGRRAELAREDALDARTMEIQAAVERVANAAIPDPREREHQLARFDLDLDDWLDEPDYLTADLDALVLRACRHMGLPDHLAARWRQLPSPTVYPEDLDDPAPEAAGPPPPPWRGSG